MKNNFSEAKNIYSEKSVIVLYSWTFLMSGLIEDKWILSCLLYSVCWSIRHHVAFKNKLYCPLIGQW